MIYYKNLETGAESLYTSSVDFSDGLIGYEQEMNLYDANVLFDCSSLSFAFSRPITAAQFIAILFRSTKNNWRKMRHIPKRRTWNIKRYRRRI